MYVELERVMGYVMFYEKYVCFYGRVMFCDWCLCLKKMLQLW